jgi:hypothetical protein
MTCRFGRPPTTSSVQRSQQALGQHPPLKLMADQTCPVYSLYPSRFIEISGLADRCVCLHNLGNNISLWPLHPLPGASEQVIRHRKARTSQMVTSHNESRTSSHERNTAAPVSRPLATNTPEAINHLNALHPLNFPTPIPSVDVLPIL